MKAIGIKKPALVSLEVKQGATLEGQNLVFKVKGTNTPIDWTGWTFTCSIKKDYSVRSVPVATIAVTTPAPTNGTLVLNSTTIADLDAGSYVYDIRGVNGAAKSYFAEGVLEVKGSATQS
jgi:hypothetical protein